MSFTTVADVIENSQATQPLLKSSQGYASGGRSFSQWGITGVPTAGVYSSTINGDALTSPVTGAIEYQAPPSGKDVYISSIQYNCTSEGILTLADRLWHNGGMSLSNTVVQTITTPAWPARDINASANGQGVMVAVEVVTGTGTGTPSFTISYTNSKGVSGRTATNINPTSASAGIGSMFLFSLEEGDQGIRSIQSFQQTSSWATGKFCLVAYRPILMLDLPGSCYPIKLDPLTTGAPKIIPGSVLYTIYTPYNSATVTTVGGLTIAYG